MELERSYENILVFCLRKIGDVIISTSGVYLLKKAYPKAKITMIVRPLTQELVRNNPIVDEVLLYNYTHTSSFSEMREIAAEIKQKNFDLAIVLDNKPRSIILAWMANIPQRIGFEKIEFRNIYLKLFYTRIIKIEHDPQNTLQVKNHEIFINAFTNRQDTAKMVMASVTPEMKIKVDTLLQNVFMEQKRESKNCLKIALCIRSGCLIKDWPLERFQAVIESLAEEYNAVFYVIGSQADWTIVETFKKQCAVSVSNLCGQTSLGELSYLLGQSDFFLSVDTGSAHIAAATDVPMVVIFGGTSPNKWGPYTKNSITLAPFYPCHPCDGTKLKCVEPKCIFTISAEVVTNACKKQLDHYKNLGIHETKEQ